jgi:hypothetical protein
MQGRVIGWLSDPRGRLVDVRLDRGELDRHLRQVRPNRGQRRQALVQMHQLRPTGMPHRSRHRTQTEAYRH